MEEMYSSAEIFSNNHKPFLSPIFIQIVAPLASMRTENINLFYVCYVISQDIQISKNQTPYIIRERIPVYVIVSDGI